MKKTLALRAVTVIFKGHEKSGISTRGARLAREQLPIACTSVGFSAAESCGRISQYSRALSSYMGREAALLGPLSCKFALVSAAAHAT